MRELSHYAKADPYHEDPRRVGPTTEGLGAQIHLRHTYRPVFPFSRDEVVGTITEWSPERVQTLTEVNVKKRRSYRNHTQQFRIEPEGSGSKVTFHIAYGGIPPALRPYAQYVAFVVEARMQDKLIRLEESAS